MTNKQINIKINTNAFKHIFKAFDEFLMNKSDKDNIKNAFYS